MNKTVEFVLIVSGIALFVSGVSLIPSNTSLNVCSLVIKTHNVINSYVVIALGAVITFSCFIGRINFKI